jgi:hypothetical protein
MITRLTTYLLERQYGFLQTYYTPEHTEFEVFDAEDQPVIHLMVKSVNEMAMPSMAQMAHDGRHLTPEADHLVQHLLQRGS